MERPDVAAELRRLARMLRDNWWLIAACALAAISAAAAYESTKDTTYQAQSKVLLLQDDPNSAIAGQAVFLDPVRQRATALELITGPNVAARAARQLGRRAPVGGSVNAAASGDSNVVTITVHNRDAIVAPRLADAYAKQYVEFRRDAVRARYDQALGDVRNRMRRLEQNQPPGYQTQLRTLGNQSQQLELLASTRLPDATVIQRANGFSIPIKPRWARNLTLAGIIGLLLGLVLAFLRDRLDDRLKTEEDVAELMPEVPLLVTVPRWRPGQRWRRDAAESYYNLGVSVRSVNGNSASSYLVTSAVGEDGKSTTALNLALALGREGRNAMLVDGDLRRPGLTEMTGAARGNGFVNVLEGRNRLDEAVARQDFRAEQKNGLRRGRKPLVTVPGDVSMLPAGRTSTAPQRLITEQSAQTLLAQARDEDRYTVIDGPPLGLFGDMLPLARQVDGVIVVVRLYHSRKRTLRVLLRQLETAGVRPLGYVLVGAGVEANSIYGY